MKFTTGTILGNYTIEKALGSGAFATVYRAHLTAAPNKVYAMKVCPTKGDNAKLSKLETTILDLIKKYDPSRQSKCIRLLDHFKLGGYECNFLVFPLLARSLDSFLEHNGRLPFPRLHVQSIMIQLLHALAFIHAIGIVHCDVKSDNILLKSNNYFESLCPRRGTTRKVLYDPQIYLSDFGIAKIINGHQQTEHVRGPFLAPELCLNLPWDYGVDIFAAGLVMHELATGQLLIAKGLDSISTLVSLHVVNGPLPRRLTEHAKKSTYLPFTKLKMNTIMPCRGNSTQLDFKKMGVDKSSIQQDALIRKRHAIATTLDVGDAIFTSLKGALLEYDPQKRPRAVDALNHIYFTVPFLLPAPLCRQ